jgi:hypothetical protein
VEKIKKIDKCHRTLKNKGDGIMCNELSAALDRPVEEVHEEGVKRSMEPGIA